MGERRPQGSRNVWNPNSNWVSYPLHAVADMSRNERNKRHIAKQPPLLLLLALRSLLCWHPTTCCAHLVLKGLSVPRWNPESKLPLTKRSFSTRALPLWSSSTLTQYILGPNFNLREKFRESDHVLYNYKNNRKSGKNGLVFHFVLLIHVS